MSALTSRWLRMSSLERRSLFLGLLFVSPWLIGFLLWTIYPLLASAYYSLTRYDIMRPPVFLGLKNYKDLFTTDETFRLVVKNTLYWVMLSPLLGVTSAFLMACLLNTRIFARSLFRAIFFFPSIVPLFVTAMIWQFLLDMQYGAVNGTLKALGLRAIPFLSNPQWVKPTLLLIHMWAQGGAMVIFLATLQDVPRSLYDAATVDGANAWQRFWHVTIPMCSPVILFNLVMGFIGGFQYFTLPWLLTEGGPNQATEFYALYLYRNAFTYLSMGKASALAWILFVVIVVFTFVLFKTTGRFVYYAGE
jgi:multiple sugar transport system permease protein